MKKILGLALSVALLTFSQAASAVVDVEVLFDLLEPQNGGTVTYLITVDGGNEIEVTGPQKIQAEIGQKVCMRAKEVAGSTRVLYREYCGDVLNPEAEVSNLRFSISYDVPVQP